jgi:hypothetical protein
VINNAIRAHHFEALIGERRDYGHECHEGAPF